MSNKIRCKICDKEYKGTSGLAAHVRSHDMTYNEYKANYILDEKPSCPICGKLPRYSKTKKEFNKYCVDHANEARKEWAAKNKNKIFGGNAGWRRGLTKKDHEGIKRQAEAISGRENNPFYNMPEEKQKEARQKQALSKRLSTSEIKKRLRRSDVSLISDYEDYKSVDSNLKFKCNECNHTFKTTLSNYQNGYKCPQCYPTRKQSFLGKQHSEETKREIANKTKLSKKEFIGVKNNLNNDSNIELLCDYQNYTKASDKYQMKCLDCDYRFERRLSNQLQFDHSCPSCGPSYNGWELAYKNCLLKEGIDHTYHPEPLETPYGFYHPDFLIKDTGVYIEIKAKYWEREEQQKKIDWLRENGYNISIVYRKKLKEIGAI